MYRCNAVFGYDFGLTPQLSARLVSLGEKFKCSVQIEYADRAVRLDSLIGLISVSFHRGDVVTVCAQGDDEENSANAVRSMLENG